MKANRWNFLIAALLCADEAQAAEPAAPGADDQPLTEFPYTPSLDVPSMDRSADPCGDFYQYSCGGWVAHNPIPADQASWSVYGKLYQDNQRYLWGILDGLARQSEGRSDNQRKIGDYFAACMDEAAAEKLGRKPRAATLDQIAALRSRKALPALLAQLQLNSGDPGFFFGFGSNQDYGDATQTIAYADAGGLGLPERDYYLDKDAHTLKLRTQYREHVAKVFGQLGDASAVAAKNAATVLRLETQLARASLKPVERRDPYKLYHMYERTALHGLTPHFDWTGYFQPLGLEDVHAMNVAEPKFYKAFDALLANTGMADLKTYLRWHAAHAAAPFLSKSFVDERFDFFDHTLRGVPQQKPRWKHCVAQVDGLLGEALGREFVDRAFAPALKTSTLKMTTQIEQAMREDIEQLSWMSAETKRQAVGKLDTIVNKIGYPDRWRDYSAVEVKRDDHFGNVQRATVFEGHRQLAKIGKPLDRAEWGMTPPTVNAYYNPQMNDINFPAGVLQPPLYDPKLDDAPNYGNTGATIGHELTHGFDDEGRQFDAKGNLKDWWTMQDALEFGKRAACVSDEYSHFTVIEDIKINGKLTLGEDAADLGGTLLAYLAWREDTKGEKLQPIDELTPEQRFFVGYGQSWCSNERDENKRLRATVDPHSPEKYRTNGVVSNMPEFQEAFHCKPQSAMVNQNRCRVW